MGKKMKLHSLFKSSEAKYPWRWPSPCTQPRTLSFRTTSNINDHIFKTINSTYYETACDESLFFSNECESISTAAVVEDVGGGEQIETVIRGLKSTERLFFEPDESNLILKEGKDDDDNEVDGNDEMDLTLALKEKTEVLLMDSENPYLDFRKSMEEMVEANGLKDWKVLEELLCWYLKVNREINHEYVICAFVDLLVGLEFASSTTSTTTITSTTTTTTSNFSNCSILSSLSFCNTCSSSSSSLSSSSFSNTTPFLTSLLEIEEINSSSTTTTSTPCMFSLSEDNEEDEELREKFVLASN